MNAAAGVGAWAEQVLAYLEFASPQLRYAVTAAAAEHQQNLGNHEHAQELARQAIDGGVPPGAPAPGLAHMALSNSSLLLGDAPRGVAIVLDAARVGLTAISPARRTLHMRMRWPPGPRQARAIQLLVLEAEVALRQARETANPTAIAMALVGVPERLVVPTSTTPRSPPSTRASRSHAPERAPSRSG